MSSKVTRSLVKSAYCISLFVLLFVLIMESYLTVPVVLSICPLNLAFKSLAVHRKVCISCGEKCFSVTKSRPTIDTGPSDSLQNTVNFLN